MRYVSIFYQEEKCQIFSIWHFRIFSDNKFEKIKNWHQFSIFDFKQKLNGRMTHGPEPPKREGEGSIRTVIFLPLTPSSQIPCPPCEFFFFAPTPPPSPPLPSHATLRNRSALSTRIREHKLSSNSVSFYGGEKIKYANGSPISFFCCK